MTNQTLKAFYYGNLSPWDTRTDRSSREIRTVKELSDAESLLIQSLPPDLRPILGRLTKAQQELDSIVAETSYIDGFKTGARFMLEILDDSGGDLKPITD